jgi:hypothetical protein
VPELGLLAPGERPQPKLGGTTPAGSARVEEHQKTEKNEPSYEASGMRVTTTRILAPARDSAVT